MDMGTLGRVAAVVALLASAAVASGEVRTATSDLVVGCGTNGTDVPTDWYFPVPNPDRGLVWVQHGFSRANDQFVDLSTRLAEAGFVVFATSLAPGNLGCAMSNEGFLADFARVFLDRAQPQGPLLGSARAAAQAAGVSLDALPVRYAFTGHSAGAGSAVHVARQLVENHPQAAADLAGLVVLDPVEAVGSALIAAGVPVVASAGLPIRTISSPPYTCNSSANGTNALLAGSSEPFVGVRLTSGSHCDAEGASTGFLCTAFCGSPQSENVTILQALVTTWLGDAIDAKVSGTHYPGGAYYESIRAAGRIVTLPESGCGDGVVGAGEQCDDGNRFAGDCCSGFCSFEAAGSACAEDANACTGDVCDGSGTCVHPPHSEPCDDGLYCTVGDRCEAGACNGVPRDCSTYDGACHVGTCDESADTCFAQARPEGTSCDDEDACTTVDLCVAGECVGGVPRSCPASGPCREVGSCDPATGACSDPVAADGVACDDGDACTVAECRSGTCLPVAGRCGDGVLDSACAEECDAGPANGSDGCCSANCTLVDVDADGLCDRDDTCFLDVVLERPRLRVTRIGHPRRDAKVTFKATLRDAGDLAPDADGIAVRLEIGSTTWLDAVVPGGSWTREERRGWRVNRRGDLWRYTDRSDASVGGVTQLRLRDRSPRHPGELQLVLAAEVPDLEVSAADLPAVLRIGLDGSGSGGRCASTAYASEPAAACRLNRPGTTLQCR